MTAVATTPPPSNPLVVCEERVASCEHVLSLAELAIDKQSDTIAALVEQNRRLQLTVDEATPLIEAQGAWYNNRWLWVGVGFVAGAYAHRELSRP